ncbi:MAG: hypothetical protein QNL32_04605 [Actinomycetes bacterium]
MKSQIALIGVGLVIAASVAYAELKPAADNTILPSVPAPEPTISSAPEPATSPAETKKPTKVKTPAPKKSATPKVSKPTISGGGDGDEGGDDGDGDEGDEGGDDD